VPLGIFGDEIWERGFIQLAPGDMLVLYTDGIIEAENAQGAFLGKERMLETVGANQGRPAREIQDAVLADIHRFVGDTPQSDDIALVVLLRDSTVGV
jgi:sigma-B regulation protein RsbU (phosphoserine phosphatase)